MHNVQRLGSVKERRISIKSMRGHRFSFVRLRGDIPFRVVVALGFGGGGVGEPVELLLDARVPIVIDCIVYSSRKMGSNYIPLASSMQFYQINGKKEKLDLNSYY